MGWVGNGDGGDGMEGWIEEMTVMVETGWMNGLRW